MVSNEDVSSPRDQIRVTSIQYCQKLDLLFVYAFMISKFEEILIIARFNICLVQLIKTIHRLVCTGEKDCQNAENNVCNGLILIINR